MSTQPGYRFVCSQKSLGAECPQRTNHLGFYRIYLAKQEFFARSYLVRFWISVSRWPAFQYVTDENFLPFHIDRFNDFGQELSGASYKWQSLLIFIGAAVTVGVIVLASRVHIRRNRVVDFSAGTVSGISGTFPPPPGASTT